MKKIEPCRICGEQFDNVFELVDHLEDDDNGYEFDPYFILPNGYKLMLGSLLRNLFQKADDVDEVERITQDTYMLLYASEVEPNSVINMVEDAIVAEYMYGLDDEYERICKNNGEDNGKGIRKQPW